MFDVGFWELLLIFGVGLMILGPERMPRVAAQIGRWIGRARRTASQLRRQLQREIEVEEFMNRRPSKPPQRPPNLRTQPSQKPGESGTTQSESAKTDLDKDHADSRGDDAPAADDENRIASPRQMAEQRDADTTTESAKAS